MSIFFQEIGSTFFQKIFEAQASFHILKFIKFYFPIHLLKTFIFWNIWVLSFGCVILQPGSVHDEPLRNLIDAWLMISCFVFLTACVFNLLGGQFQNFSLKCLYPLLIVQLNFSHMKVVFNIEQMRCKKFQCFHQ